MNTQTQLPPLLIPAYQPDQKMIGLVNELLKKGYPEIVVVNDGSSPDKDYIFEQVGELDRVKLLSHEKNKGKGQALKTGFSYILQQGHKVGVVTLDADGQHLPEDIFEVARSLSDHPQQLILGARAFDKDVPLRSSFGNTLTRHIFGFLIGKKISDTQTGLRGIPLDFLEELIKLKTGRYEFELDMLVKASTQRIEITEVPITTVYENNNESSHFNPLIDSLRIYFIFLRFVGTSIVTAGIDFIVFALVHEVTKNIATSMVASRIVAATFNFICVRNVVFKHSGSLSVAAGKFVLLVIGLATLSYSLIFLATEKLGMQVLLSKIIVETGLFVGNFMIQKIYIFNKDKKKEVPIKQVTKDQA